MALVVVRVGGFQMICQFYLFSQSVIWFGGNEHLMDSTLLFGSIIRGVDGSVLS